jgi:glycosyltransferase involved in cell wall biosynthesis
VDATGVFSPDKWGRAERDKLRIQLGIQPGSVVLGYVGRIVQDKGMHELAEAWKALKGAHSNVKLLLVGDMEEKDPILPGDRALFESDPDVLMPGFSTNIPAYMSAMDVFVMPSYREGFGVTNIEAAAMKLPVVSSAIPGCVDSVKDGKTGILVPPRDPEQLVTAIEVYLKDPALRASHGAAGRKRVLADFQPEIIWRGLYAEYRHFLDQLGGGSKAF